MTRAEAHHYRKSIEDAAALQSDEKALDNIYLYPKWIDQIGKAVNTGERYVDSDKLWKVLQPHTAMENWRPADSPSLYVEVSIEEWPEIPENIPAENPWMNGRKGTWKGEHYICKMDNCVWNPEQLPSAWEKV